MSLDIQIINSINDPAANHIVLVEIEWPGGTIYVHNRLGQKNWDGKTWWGLGELGQIGAKEDGVKKGRMAISLQVENETLLDEARKDDAVFKPVRIYLGVLDDKERIMVAQRIVYKFIVGVNILHSNVKTISLELGSHRERSAQPKNTYRMNSSMHKAKYPSDTYFDDIEAIKKGPLSGYSGSQAVGSGGGSHSEHGGYMEP